MNPRDLKFTDATPEQFKEFWEGERWQLIPQGHGYSPCAIKNLKTQFHGSVSSSLYVWGLGVIGLKTFGGSMAIRQVNTFGEALDALNELANTRIMGGWA